MKRIISIFLAVLCLSAFPVTALAADSITVSVSKTEAAVGDEVTVSGVAAADTYITIRGTDADGDILYFSALLSDSAGAYSQTFKVPEMDDGTLTISAGNGSVTASAEISVYSLYTVTFDKNDGDTEANPTTIDVKAGGTIGTLPSSPTRSGYTFKGWNTSSNGSGTAFTESTAVTADITVYAQWTKNSSGGSSSDSSGSSSSTTYKTTTSTSDGMTTATTEVNASTGSDGTAKASVPEDQITDAIKKATDSSATQGTKAAVDINIDTDDDATGVSVTIPQAAFEAMITGGVDELTITAPQVKVTFDSTALAAINEKAAGDFIVKAVKSSDTALSDTEKALIGSRPVYELSVTSGGTTISSFGGGKATVSIPYTLADGEDANKIVIYYISSSGELVMVPNCVYDAESGMVTFTTTHFSTYAVGYNDVSFTDVSGWYADYVSCLAARGIISGTGDGQFSPDANITRAQFVAILARLSGDDLSVYTASSFSDAATTDWYFAAVQWAYAKGVASGSDGKFAPGANITREQMAVMLYNYAKYAGADISNVEGMSVREFSDYAGISSWALEPIQWAINNSIISGNGDGSFAPAANATRAQAAKMVALLLKGMIGS